ncbi:protease [Streptomyces fructofermentans]|uniref:protease n=1 Tax=Streptomyces fructofermentans TaxID=152141 RepID=UPI0037BA3739
MTKFLLALHVLVAIVAIGPVTVAASMFPPAARRALADPEDPRAAETVRLLHRICRVYAGIGVGVPVLGFATAQSMGVLGDAWLIVSIVLTTCAAAVLLALVLPRQEALLDAVDGAGPGAASHAGTAAGGPDAPTATAVPGTGAATDTAAPDTRTATGTAGSMDSPDTAAVAAGPRATVRLAMFTGIFNLLWATVTVLMIVRPGSTTGA